jgi:hypothetical protein
MPTPMPEQLKQQIVKMVCGGADGMFLFAKLVLDNLHGQDNLEDICNELHPNTFPHGFEQALVLFIPFFSHCLQL